MISGTIQAGPMKPCTEIAGDPKKYSCLIKRKIHKKRLSKTKYVWTANEPI